MSDPSGEQVEKAAERLADLAEGRASYYLLTQDREAMRLILRDRERLREVEEAASAFLEIIDKAGLDHLVNGVQLGPTVWFVKASERRDRIAKLIRAEREGVRE
jgi:hypothetical protein